MLLAQQQRGMPGDRIDPGDAQQLLFPIGFPSVPLTIASPLQENGGSDPHAPWPRPLSIALAM